uniref:Uncharacterized protein n=1 Tax=Arundo donax TaxID=35708 RepID=A0A0A8ZKN0_ARUDO
MRSWDWNIGHWIVALSFFFLFFLLLIYHFSNVTHFYFAV